MKGFPFSRRKSVWVLLSSFFFSFPVGCFFGGGGTDTVFPFSRGKTSLERLRVPWAGARPRRQMKDSPGEPAASPQPLPLLCRGHGGSPQLLVLSGSKEHLIGVGDARYL